MDNKTMFKFVGSETVMKEFHISLEAWKASKYSTTTPSNADRALIHQLVNDKLEWLVTECGNNIELVNESITLFGGSYKLAKFLGYKKYVVDEWRGLAPYLPSDQDYDKIRDHIRSFIGTVNPVKGYRVIEIKKEAPLFSHIYSRFESNYDIEQLLGLGRNTVIARRTSAMKKKNVGRGYTTHAEARLMASDLLFWYEYFDGLTDLPDEEDMRAYIRLAGFKHGSMAAMLGVSGSWFTTWISKGMKGEERRQQIMKLFKKGYESFKREVLV